MKYKPGYTFSEKQGFNNRDINNVPIELRNEKFFWWNGVYWYDGYTTMKLDYDHPFNKSDFVEEINDYPVGNYAVYRIKPHEFIILCKTIAGNFALYCNQTPKVPA